MEEPEIGAREPAAVELEAGRTYAWCACGRSGKQPMCDGAHKDGEFRPVRFKAEENGQAWLCQCKRTRTPPYCDGSHNAL